MYHFFAKKENIFENYILIDGDDVKHLRNVLRIRPGERIIMSSGENIDYYCVVSDIEEDRIIASMDSKKSESKVKRWNLIAESAAKQSKRSVLPLVNDVMTFKQAAEYAKKLDIVLMPYECADGMQSTKELINSIRPGQSVGIFIGPEGGFDGEELTAAHDNKFSIITLGKRILRTETAGMMLLSVLMYNLEE